MPNVKEQTFERVHDTQFIYRQLLDAFARPGQISSLEQASSKLTSLSPLHAMVACFAMTLFDGEVSFALEMKEQEGLDHYVRQQTFSRIQPAADADYIIAEGGVSDERIQALLGKLKKGTLLRPEEGATVFIQVESLGSEACPEGSQGSQGGCWTLTGPGIQHSRVLCVQGLPKAWIEERAKINAEYPLGIDIVLFTEGGQITALPRTTIIREGGV